jgi:hypothetical protein
LDTALANRWGAVPDAAEANEDTITKHEMLAPPRGVPQRIAT